jgi:DNA-binding XRE family transcriptional regulator
LLRIVAGLLEVIMQSPLALVRDRASEGHDAAHAHDDTRSSDFDALEHRVGVNLARLRAERQLSLDALARASGVSRAMLAQIESARSVPSIKVLCRLRRR